MRGPFPRRHDDATAHSRVDSTWRDPDAMHGDFLTDDDEDASRRVPTSRTIVILASLRYNIRHVLAT